MSGEDHTGRVNRELIEFLNELRVALPGVQVLFAFLLIVPFQVGFAQVSQIARNVYFVGLVSSAIAIVFLIAPVSYHRLNLRRGTAEKEELLLTSNRLALFGTAFLGIGIVCSLFVVTDLLFGTAAALLLVLAAAVVIIGLWFGLPIQRRRSGAGEQPEPDGRGGR